MRAVQGNRVDPGLKSHAIGQVERACVGNRHQRVGGSSKGKSSAQLTRPPGSVGSRAVVAITGQVGKSRACVFVKVIRGHQTGDYNDLIGRGGAGRVRVSRVAQAIEAADAKIVSGEGSQASDSDGGCA